jgi:hypothetical protein
VHEVAVARERSHRGGVLLLALLSGCFHLDGPATHEPVVAAAHQAQGAEAAKAMAPGGSHAPDRDAAAQPDTAEIRGRVQRAGARAAGNAPLVVSACRLDGDGRSPAPRAVLWRRNGGFAPPFLVVAAGQEIEIRNEEPICHQFFSSSAPNSFELPLLQPGGSVVTRLHEPGFVHLYCKLHAGKQTTLLVSPSPHAAVVDEDGFFCVGDLRPGRYLLETWSEKLPRQRFEWTARAAGSAGADLVIDAGLAQPSR